MTYRTLLITALLTLAACTQAPPGVDPIAPGDPTAALVQRFNMGQGLRGLALDAARATNTYASLVQQLGDALAAMSSSVLSVPEPDALVASVDRRRPITVIGATNAATPPKQTASPPSHHLPHRGGKGASPALTINGSVMNKVIREEITRCTQQLQRQAQWQLVYLAFP